MLIALYAIFLKGPVWLRLLVLAGFGLIFLFGCLYALTTIHEATQRTVPAHVTHTHAHPTSFIRS